jgi:hypothetical protein
MFFSFRGLVLTAIMLVFILVLFNARMDDLNVYARAYENRIGLYSEKIDSLTRITSWKQRMLLRHVANASIPFWIAENRRETDTILLPPAAYADRYIKAQAIWTDPRIFAYMAGFLPVIAWDDTVRRNQANAFIALEPAAITITRRGGSVNIDSLLAEYETAAKNPVRKGAEP